MREQLEKFIKDIKEIFIYLLSPLSPRLKRLLFIGLPLFGSIAYASFQVFDRMNYSPLYTNLSPQDGAAIVKELEASKIPFAISGGGTVIEVPRDAVYQTRLKLAGKGVPVGGGVGFEIFEKTPFGASEFTQQVNYLRALQGELSRTINSIAAVHSSRVHLAIPARSSFLGAEEKPSASVVVDIQPGFHLSPDQVLGIVNLVASSVPKLSAERVTVIDSSGRPLKEIIPAVASSEAEKLNSLKIKHEQELERRIETMLDPVLGSGKVVVRANVEINSQETQMTKEEFDPENKVVRSQRQSVDDAGTKGGGTPGVQANIPGGDATKIAGDGSKKSSDVVTYEVGRTLSRISEPRGQVQKLSVGVLIDGKYENNKYVARTAAELELIKGMVKRAVGFNEERGDQIDVANVPFKVQPPVARPTVAPDLKDMVTSPTGLAVGAGVLIGFGALAFFMLRSKSKNVKLEQPASRSEQAVPSPAAAEVQEQVAVAAQKIVVAEDPRKEQLTQIARDYHDATVRIIRMWLQEDSHKARANNDNGAISRVTA